LKGIKRAGKQEEKSGRTVDRPVTPTPWKDESS